jgi:hypothetical protein
MVYFDLSPGRHIPRHGWENSLGSTIAISPAKSLFLFPSSPRHNDHIAYRRQSWQSSDFEIQTALAQSLMAQALDLKKLRLSAI